MDYSEQMQAADQKNQQSAVDAARNAAQKAMLKQALVDKVKALNEKKKPGKKGPVAGIEPWLKNRGKVDPGYGRIAPTKGEKVTRMPQPKAVPLTGTRRYQ